MILFCPMMLPRGSPFESNTIPRTRMRRLASLVVSKQNGELNSDRSGIDKKAYVYIHTYIHAKRIITERESKHRLQYLLLLCCISIININNYTLPLQLIPKPLLLLLLLVPTTTTTSTTSTTTTTTTITGLESIRKHMYTYVHTQRRL